MLTITDECGKNFGGVTLSNHLNAELVAFSGGAAGRALLGPILGQGGTAYEVVIKDSAPTATSKTRVTINPKETKSDVANGVDDLK